VTTLRARVLRVAVVVTGGVLLVVGVGVGALLHVRARTAQDAALLAAAQAHSDPHAEPDWVVAGGGQRAVPVTFLRDGSELPDSSWYGQALGAAEPLYFRAGGRRWLLVDVAASTGAVLEVDVPHVAAAWAPEVTLARSVGPFALSYGLVASLAMAVAVVVLRRLLSDAVRPLSDATRDVSRVVGVGDRKRLAEGGPEEVAHLLGSVNALLDRLEAAFDSQARFTADAAHELRTPVTVLRGELEVALRRPRAAEAYEEALRRAHEAVVRLQELVEALLALTRVDAGHADADRAWEHASALIHEALRQERDALEAAGVPVRLDLRDDPELHVHEPLVVAALTNLLRNVARHAGGAPAKVTVHRQGDVVCFVVDDGGPGLDGREPAALMDRFAHTGREGLGLGLPLAREIARRHGGDCTMADRPGGGMRATFTLAAPDGSSRSSKEALREA